MQMKSMTDNFGRRLGIERKRFSYILHIPERRPGKERRSGIDRRRDRGFKIEQCKERRAKYRVYYPFLVVLGLVAPMRLKKELKKVATTKYLDLQIVKRLCFHIRNRCVFVI